MIAVRFREPCRCEACVIAGVSDRERPVQPDLHGRELAIWWREYDKAREAAKRFGFGAKEMPR